MRYVFGIVIVPLFMVFDLVISPLMIFVVLFEGESFGWPFSWSLTKRLLPTGQEGT